MSEELKFVESQKGKKMLIYQHFRYRFDYLLATNGAKSWRCVNCNAGCKGRITTLGDSVLTSDTTHNHPEEPAENEAFEIRACIRERAVSTFEPPRQILQRCENHASQETTALLPSYKSSQRTIERIRQKNNVPYPVPTDLSEVAIPEPLRCLASGENFLLHDSGPSDPERFLMFGTAQNLLELGLAEHWFLDGTFSIAPTLFEQLYTIHAIKKNKNIPLVYILLTRKHQPLYTRVFERLFELNDQLNPDSIMLDFELAAINAISSVFPNASIKGCYFHFSKAIYKHIKGTPAEALYKNNEEARILLKCLLSMAFVPEADVIEVFEELQDSCDKFPDLIDVITYFEETYIGRLYRRRRLPPRYAISLRNMNERTLCELPRTNNAVEGWHRAFQTSVGASHPSIFKLIEKLHLEQSGSERILAKLHAGETFAKFSKKKYEKLNDRLETILADYDFRFKIDFLKGLALNLKFN